MYGEHSITQNNGVSTGILSGFKDLYGFYVKGFYFFYKSIGVTADVAFRSGENGAYIENATSSITYETNADYNFQKVGLRTRFIGEEYPVKISFSTGVGRGSFSAYYLIKTNTSQIDYEGKAGFPMADFQTELTIPVFKGLYVFYQYEYSVSWTDEFNLIHDTGSEYHEIKYKHPGLSGHNFRFGAGYEF